MKSIKTVLSQQSTAVMYAKYTLFFGFSLTLSSLFPISADRTDISLSLLKGGRTEYFRGTTYYLYEPDLDNQEIIFHYKTSEKAPINRISDIEAKYGDRLAFATNGGIFNPKGEPLGLYIEQGNMRFPINTDQGMGNFFLQPNGVFYINRYGTPNILSTKSFLENFAGRYNEISYALQSGPILFFRNEMHPAFNAESKNRYIRSAVGLLNYNTKQIVFVLSKTPVSFHEFATFIRLSLGCNHALYLDGNISKMYNPDINLGLSTADYDFSVIVSVINNK